MNSDLSSTFAGSVTATSFIGDEYYLNGVKIIYTTGFGPEYNCRIIANESTTASLQDGMYINYNSTGGNNADCRFYANGTIQRMHIDANTGHVGIANNTPDYKLDINGDCNLSSGSVYRINGLQIDSQDILYLSSGTEERIL